MSNGTTEVGVEPRANTEAIVAQPAAPAGPCRVLSLDGGGAKGFYTIGVLKEVEGLVGSPLCGRFRLIFGTSTGAIIAALLGLGHTVDEVHALYKGHVPRIMRRWTAWGKTRALRKLAAEVFKESKFEEFRTGIGIVATNWGLEKPLIFKSQRGQAHGQVGTFVPGMGCTIADAVRASCSAYPFFNRPKLKTSRGEHVDMGDGGYCANNPTLYAITEALTSLGQARGNLRVLSLGVGTYPEPRRGFIKRSVRKLKTVRLLQKTLNVNTGSMEQLRKVLFEDIQTVRISEGFSAPELATDLMEHNLKKLDMLYQRGRKSFGQHERELRALLL